MIHNSTLRNAAFAAFLLATASSCDVLTQDPPTALTEEDAFANADRISKTATGMYDQLQNAEFLGGRALIYSDIRSDDTNVAAFFGNVSNFAQLPNDAIAQNAWTGGYRTLYGANFFLQGIAKNAGKAPAALETQYIGEAKFIRALVYFHLVNLFAQPYNFTADASHPGVPLQLVAPDVTTAFDPSQNLARSTVKQVYEQIEKDLNDAITALPETYATPFDRTARATKDAARSLLSRVYLYEGKYAEARDMAGAVITGARHTLAPSPATPFMAIGAAGAGLTSESIFSVAMNSADNPNTNNALGQHYGRLRRGDIVVTPYARIDSTQFRSKDRRRTLLLDPPTFPATTTVNVFTLKYNNSSFDYVPIVRYSEVLLNRAEGLAQTDAGVSAAAIVLLNQVRRRSLPNVPAYADYTAASFANKQALIDAILFERRLELAFEGHRYYDLMRYKRNSSRVNYGSDKAIFPIPQIDTQQNPNLTQNPGYN
ncbi:RagB/SusD family nutrient uptake outer membrane protein [Hymenobacter sp. BT175]|uniref:RagB/SusD family nutrient uptake outer membrane protein n=1 Tax=Hymenobacter translucens TaxID=2886507 RepID=UPI001D0E2142|nr:RagB/SusD family nutrient uptake outer membrane protein [Hymenobacter translucens]MCC2546995.1 RagB/SusD family nutrient uptake outer membrane protein [Hymenobacter translucens]